MTTDSDILFYEKQQFRQWWIMLIMVGTSSVFVAGIIKQLIRGQQFGNKPMSNTDLIVATAVLFLLNIFIFSIRLETVIKPDGIYVRFFPFIIKYKHFSWSTLTKSYVRQYSPIAEYGGWGLRLGLFGKGQAYNVSGDKGLQLEFTNGKKLLIGTNKPEELNTVLLSIGQLRP